MAQVAGTAALTGVVTDPSGALVVGAEVTATNLATGAKRSAQTDAAGKYLMTQVPPGDYRVEVTATGFKTAVRPRVELPIGITSALDIVLEFGDIAETVEVQAMAAAVNTTDASMGTPLSGAEIRSLPSLDLNPAGLLSLQAGVAFVPSASDTPGGYGGGRILTVAAARSMVRAAIRRISPWMAWTAMTRSAVTPLLACSALPRAHWPSSARRPLTMGPRRAVGRGRRRCS